ncbi:hypothetical protein JVU11DRAFT_7661 [Chiua virens]|nr:hypothetical protein JVU11DRAFT_7661 [Chiua virens]
MVAYLHEHRLEGAQGGKFKQSTFNAAAVHIQPLLVSSKAKDGSSIKTKFSQLRATYSLIASWRNMSGVHWDNKRGANIEGAAAHTNHGPFKDFANGGWVYLEMMEDIMVGGVATGAYAFQGGAVQPQVTEPDEDDTNDATTGTLPAVAPRSSGPSVANPTQQLIVNAVTSTVAAINSPSYSFAHIFSTPFLPPIIQQRKAAPLFTVSG